MLHASADDGEVGATKTANVPRASVGDTEGVLKLDWVN